MERLGRWLFNLAAVVSVVLCIATAVFGVRSVYVQDLPQISYRWYQWPDQFRSATLCIGSTGGIVGFKFGTTDFDLARYKEEQEWIGTFRASRPTGLYWAWIKSPTIQSQNDVSRLVPNWRHTGSVSTEAWTLTLPHWYLILLFTVLPWLWVRRRSKLRHRFLDGRCLACGYDLRATPERCPECGAISGTVSAPTR